MSWCSEFPRPPPSLRDSSPYQGELCLRATAGGGGGRLRVLQRRGFFPLPARAPAGSWAAHSRLEAHRRAPALSTSCELSGRRGVLHQDDERPGPCHGRSKNSGQWPRRLIRPVAGPPAAPRAPDARSAAPVRSPPARPPRPGRKRPAPRPDTSTSWRR